MGKIHSITSSSSIKTLEYKAEKKQLHVEFMSGAKGYYSGVTATVYTQLMNSPSKGKFLASEIRAKPKKYEWIAHSPEGGTVSSGVNTESGMESSSLKTQLKKSLDQKAKIIPIHIQSRNFHQTMLKAKKRLD